MGSSASAAIMPKRPYNDSPRRWATLSTTTSRSATAVRSKSDPAELPEKRPQEPSTVAIEAVESRALIVETVLLAENPIDGAPASGEGIPRQPEAGDREEMCRRRSFPCYLRGLNLRAYVQPGFDDGYSFSTLEDAPKKPLRLWGVTLRRESPGPTRREPDLGNSPERIETE